MFQHSLIMMAGIAAAMGVFSHLAYFIRGEHHLQAYNLLLLSLFSPVVLFVFLFLRSSLSVVEVIVVVSTTWWTFMGSLWTSMIVYRLFFHRLRSFDGPFLWKISKVLGHAVSIRKLNGFRVLDTLHQEYGDYVRTGPAELSIIDPAVAEAVYGPKSRCSKGDFYDINYPFHTVQEMREKSLHDRRRRTAWDPGFSMKALRNYEPRVMKYVDELGNQFAAYSGKPVNASAWCTYFGFDVMGDLAFGKSFQNLSRGEYHWVLQIMKEQVRPFGIISHVPWVLNMTRPISFIGKEIARFEKYSQDSLEERMKMKPTQPDVMTSIISAEPLFQDPEQQHLLLIGDSKLIIIAGSDTTSSTLAFACYYLARDPSQSTKLREELKDVSMDDGFSYKAIQDLKHLNGFVMETLRLHPAVGGGPFRTTPPEGLQIGDRYIPGNTQIMAPPYSLHRSPKAYANPTSFIPERWYSQPELIKVDPPPFLTFAGSSTYSCVGKNLAYMELKMAISKLVTRFDIHFAPGEDGGKLLNESLDVFLTELADMYLEFHERK